MYSKRGDRHVVSMVSESTVAQSCFGFHGV